MSIKKSFVILFLIGSLLLLPSCEKTDKANHPSVKQLAEDIEKIENVEKTYGYFRAFDLIVEVLVTDEFDSEKNSNKILDLAKKHLDMDVMNEMRKEREEEYPPDIEIYIRNGEGRILVDITGSCYASYERSKVPDYNEYVWRLSGWESSVSR